MDGVEGQNIQGRYFGAKAPLFKLALGTSALTLLTLGIYRFWAKTRIRKYIWSSTDGDGARFEYTGTGLEKFLGFLIALVVLAIYMGIIQLALFYFGFNLFSEPTNNAEAVSQIVAGYISFFALLPFIYFAVYRSQRYKMSRTGWTKQLGDMSGALSATFFYPSSRSGFSTRCRPSSFRNIWRIAPGTVIKSSISQGNGPSFTKVCCMSFSGWLC